MLPYEREFFIARIKSGYLRLNLDNKIYKFKMDRDLIYESEEVYYNVYQDSMNRGVASIDDVHQQLLEHKIWNEELEESLKKTLPDDIEKLKVRMYEEFSNADKVEKLRLYVNAAKKELTRLAYIRMQFDYLSCAGAALYARWQYIAENAVLTIDGKRPDWNNVSIHDIIAAIHSSNLDESIIRELARTDPWSTIWSLGKRVNNIFGVSSSDYTDEQKRIVSWSIVYDNCKEHEDCPEDAVFDDDDCFDGWMIIKNRQNKKESTRERLTRKIGRNMNADEVFIHVQNELNPEGENLEDILSLNSPMAKAVIQSRVHAVNQTEGPIKYKELPDIQMNVNMMENRIGILKQGGV